MRFLTGSNLVNVVGHVRGAGSVAADASHEQIPGYAAVGTRVDVRDPPAHNNVYRPRQVHRANAAVKVRDHIR